jgi:hypothetical protein
VTETRVYRKGGRGSRTTGVVPVAVGDIDPMSRSTGLMGLPTCTAVSTTNGRRCTRVAGHDEGTGSDRNGKHNGGAGQGHPANLHVHADRSYTAREVW